MNQTPVSSASHNPTPTRRRRKLLIFVIVLFGPAIVIFSAAFLKSFRPLPAMPSPSGKVLEATAAEWGNIVLRDSGCVVVNNLWNKNAAGKGFPQEVFVETLNDRAVPGWRWRSPWQTVPTVVSQPQIVCGDKPWDAPKKLFADFPFRVGSKHLTANFDVKMHAVGTYNLAFTLWGVRSLPAKREAISHEIMIWTAKSGQVAAGSRSGSLTVNGTVYDVYVSRDHKDASGANSNMWTYVAFVAREPLLRGTIDFTAFSDYLVSQKLLSSDHYITSVELGNEVSSGTGIVELQEFSLRFE